MLAPLAAFLFTVTAAEVWFWAARSGILLGFVWLAWRSPLVAVLAWFVASPAGAYWLPRYNRIELAVVLIVFLLAERRKRKQWREAGPFEWLYGAFCLLVGLNALWLAQDQHSAFRLWLEAFVLPFGIYLLARELVEEQTFARSVRPALLILGLLVAGCALVEEIARIDLLSTAQGLRSIYPGSRWLRVNGPYPDDATLAAIATLLLLILLPGVFGADGNTGSKQRLGTAITCVLLALTVFFTFSRTFWFLLLVGVLAFLVVSRRRVGRMAVPLAFLLVVIGGAVAYQRAGSSEFFRQRILDPANLYGRVATYRMAWDMAREQPWVGVGFGNFTAAARTRPATAYRGVLPVDHPHSGYFLLLAETGLPGLALFLLAFGSALRPAVSLFRRAPTAAGAGLAVGSFLAANLLFTLLLVPSVNQLVFFAVGMLAAKPEVKAQ